MKLKAAATAIGDPTADRPSAHGFRRGFACDLAMEGDSLRDILEAGDWRSAAFRAYLADVEQVGDSTECAAQGAATGAVDQS